VHLGRARERATGEDAVRLPLERGWVASAWGERLTPTLARLALLEEPPPAEEALP
jgi:urease accessory protein